MISRIESAIRIFSSVSNWVNLSAPPPQRTGRRLVSILDADGQILSKKLTYLSLWFCAAMFGHRTAAELAHVEKLGWISAVVAWNCRNQHARMTVRAGRPLRYGA